MCWRRIPDCIWFWCESLWYRVRSVGRFQQRKWWYLSIDFREKFCYSYKWILFVVRPRKRIRKYYQHKLYLAKDRVERGLERVTNSGRTIRAKTFNVQIICKCQDVTKQRPSCSSKIDVMRQKEIFDSYYQNMKWSQKTLFIRASVKRSPVKMRKVQQFPLRQENLLMFTHLLMETVLSKSFAGIFSWNAFRSRHAEFSMP